MTMIERVTDRVFDIIWPTQEWDGSETACRAVAASAARSAIEAMRAPTDHKEAAGGATAPNQITNGDCRDIFTAMIDAALEEGK